MASPFSSFSFLFSRFDPMIQFSINKIFTGWISKVRVDKPYRVLLFFIIWTARFFNNFFGNRLNGGTRNRCRFGFRFLLFLKSQFNSIQIWVTETTFKIILTGFVGALPSRVRCRTFSKNSALVCKCFVCGFFKASGKI